MFNSPNTAAMMGAVPVHRRGIAAGARTMLQNTGAVLSIAFVMAIVTTAVPQDVLLQIFSGLASSLSDDQLDPFVANMHTALWVLAATSLVGAAVSLLRPRHGGPPVAVAEPAAPGHGRPHAPARDPRGGARPRRAPAATGRPPPRRDHPARARAGGQAPRPARAAGGVRAHGHCRCRLIRRLWPRAVPAAR
jgi:hypothetical protein